MGADLIISEILDYQYENEIRFKRITTIHNWDVIEKLLDKGRKNWCLEGECGAEFELLGDTLLEFANEIKKYDKNFDDTKIDIDEWYRCSLSY